jgi:hypothetical protein
MAMPAQLRQARRPKRHSPRQVLEELPCLDAREGVAAAIAVYASSPPSPVAMQHSLPSGRYPLLGPDFHRLDRTSLRLAHSLHLPAPLQVSIFARVGHGQRFCRANTRAWLDRGTHCRDRVSLGRRTNRPLCRDRGRARPAKGGRHRHGAKSGHRIKPGDIGHPDRAGTGGSSPTPKTMGIAAVAALTASAAGMLAGAAITATRRSTSSAATAGRRSYRPSSQ